jgi:carboxyl-terminal processing protease
LILDMRDNGGGYVSTAVNVAKTIIPEGPIVYFENSDGTERVYSSSLDEDEVPFEIVALVNKHSASATEFVAGAIKDSGVGELVGETTYGKGVAQFMFDYEFGYKLKLTMEEFFTRDKNKINKIGVDPDYFVEIPDYLIGNTRYFINDQLSEVIEIEKVLNHLGYNVGNPDFLFDQKTFDAIKQFQIDQGLYGYGVCDLTTQTKLNEALQASIEAKDPQLNTAVSLILNKIDKN